jgi:hypothetical protein
LRIPTPAELAARRGASVRPQRTAPTLGNERHPDATYWLETNAGIAFQHCGRLDLLAEHYGEQLKVVDDVHAEWENLAERAIRSPMPWATEEEREDLLQRSRVRTAAMGLVADATLVLGPAVQLPLSEADAVNTLRIELAALPVAAPPPDDDDPWTDRGECASVRAADLRPPPAVLATNDAKGGRLAHNHGIAVRTTAEVLREMVLAGTGSLTATQAWGLHLQMTQVTRMRLEKRPSGPEYFGQGA